MSARARWAVPAGAALAVGIVIGATAVASAAQPSLPATSLAQLLVDVQQGASKPLGPFTATVQETANLGLPALPQIADVTGQTGQFSVLNVLAGTTTVNIWYLDHQHIRIAEPVQMGETDLRLGGRQLWLWNSKTQTATHVVLPAHAPNGQAQSQVGSPTFNASASDVSPITAARQALAAVGRTTTVRLGPNATVAGRAAYQISIAPKGRGSLIGQILIAIDASRHIPLQLQVFARGSSSPAFQIGFTALTLGPPAMSNFAFTPPAGAKVKTITVPTKLPGGLANGGLAGLGLGPLGVLGSGAVGVSGSCAGPNQACRFAWPIPGGLPALKALRTKFEAQLPKNLTPAQRAAAWQAFMRQVRGSTSYRISVSPGQPKPRLLAPPLPKALLRQLRAQFIAHLPKNLTPAQRAAAIAAFDRKLAAAMKSAPSNGGGFFNFKAQSAAPAAAEGPRVVGTGWTSVLVTPANPAVAAAVNQLVSGQATGGIVRGWTSSAPAQTSSSSGGVIGFSSSSSVSAVQGGSAPVPPGPYLMVLQAVLKATTAVHGKWGSGRLLQTALLSVLITSKGQILAGAVTPSVLFADAASAR